jgi:hypothetical protein
VAPLKRAAEPRAVLHCRGRYRRPDGGERYRAARRFSSFAGPALFGPGESIGGRRLRRRRARRARSRSRGPWTKSKRSQPVRRSGLKSRTRRAASRTRVRRRSREALLMVSKASAARSLHPVRIGERSGWGRIVGSVAEANTALRRTHQLNPDSPGDCAKVIDFLKLPPA